VTAEERIRRATEPWFITEPLLFGVWTLHRLVACPTIRTLRVGAGRVEYDPGFVLALPEATLRALLRLEALRILLEHPYRRRTLNGEGAWLASNVTLSEHVRTGPIALPSARDVFGSDEHNRQYYEYYCDRLRLFHAWASGGEAGGGDGGRDVADLREHLDAGSGAETTALWRDDALFHEEIAALVRDAAATHRWGTVPGSLQVVILANLRPRVDYRDVLRRFRTSILSSRRELTRMRPSRRYGFSYLGSRRPLCARLLVAVDVSGSIADEQLAEAFSVVNRLFRHGVEDVDVIQFDVRVTGPALTLRSQGRRRFSVTGRGGTSFAPVIAYLDEHPGYDGMIVITDGMAPRPPSPANRHVRVVWLFNSEQAWRAMAPNVAHIGRSAYIHPG